MGKARVELPDGRKAIVEYDTPEQFEAAMRDLTQPRGDQLTGWGEAALTVGSSAIATSVAGIAGLVTAGAKGLGLTNADPAEVVRGAQEAFTYQPRTQTGEIATSIVAYPFEKLAQGADWIGQKALDATGSPAIAAAVNTGVQFAPSLFLRGKGTPKAGRSGSGAARPTPEVAAREFVSRAVGMDWDSLPVQIKTRLTEIARDARNLDSLDPAAVRRQAGFESLDVPVPATRGQIARDPVQMRNEGNVAAMQQGAPIREVYDAQNRALVENLDLLKGKQRGKARTAEDAGRSVQDNALRAKAARAQAQVNRNYETARATEPDAVTTAQPLYELLGTSPEITRLGWMESWLNRAKVTKVEKGPDGTIVETQRPVKAVELDDLRKRAVKIARAGGTDAVYAGDVIAAIDQAMDGIPAAAKAWQKARQSHREMKREFADQGAIADLVENYPSSADRRVALEGTVQRIANGSLEDIRTVKRTLLTGGDAATRVAGKQAWRDVRQQVIEQIRAEATKGVATLPDGSPNVSVAALKRAVDKIGPERLNEIFGPSTAQKLQRIVQVAQDIKTLPPTSVPIGSSTLQNVLALLGNTIEKLPVIGSPLVQTAAGVAQVKNIGAASRQAKAAMQNPLTEAAMRSRNNLARRAAGRNALAATPATVPREPRR